MSAHDRLAGPAEPPARLHGDLWSGNVHADSEGRAWLIDPSAYGGHREVDLAMLRLFGAPSERLFSAYEELTPLAEGWEERVGFVAAAAPARPRGAFRRLLPGRGRTGGEALCGLSVPRSLPRRRDGALSHRVVG
jgi:hypothetical protein